MKHLNKVELIGTVGRIESQTSSKGNQYLKFSIAINTYRKTDVGFDQTTDWFSCTSFGLTAERFESKLKVGDTVMATGRLTNNQYEKDGEKRSSMGIVIFDINILKSKGDAQYQNNNAQTATSNYSDEAPF